jgi:hypothetical protein
MTFTQKVRIVSLEMACKSIFLDIEEKDLLKLLDWIALDDDTPIPEKLVPHEEYKSGENTRDSIIDLSTLFFGILTMGAKLAINEGTSEKLTMEELATLVETL